MSREKEIAIYCRRLPRAHLRPSCEALVRSCVEQREKGATSFTLVGPKGQRRTLKGVAACLKEALRLPTLFGPLPASRLSTKKRTPSPAEYARCDSVGAKGSAVHSACRGFVEICVVSPDGPISIPTTDTNYAAANRAECLQLASALAKSGFVPATEMSPPAASPKTPDSTAPASQEHPASASAKQLAEPEEIVPSDRKPILKSFSEVALRLHVTKEEPREEQRILMLGGGKGLPIRLRYTVRPIEGEHRYLMTYTIFRGKEKLCEERSLEFAAEGGRINLAFELDPWKENDLSSFRSVRIVTQK